MWIVPKQSKSLHRNLAQQFIQSAVMHGMPSTQIYNELVKAGLGYHRQTVFEDIINWRNAIGTWKRVNEGDLSEPIPSGLYIETQRHLDAEFETVVAYDVREWGTGRITTKYLTIKHEYWTPYGATEMIENTYSAADLLTIGEDIMKHYPIDGDVLGGRVIIGYRRSR